MDDEVFFREWTARAPGARRSVPRAASLADLLALRPAGRPVLTVVGSKGKGTAATYASAVLAAAGLSVCTVTSPAYRTNRERIRLNGQAISPAELQALAATLDKAMAELPPPAPGYLSPAGLFTLAGALHAQNVNADVLVLEAGMGGRSDEVSLFPPDVLAITTIFGEHLGILGNTPAEIATEKAAVATPTTRAILTLPQSPDVTTALTTLIPHTETIPPPTTGEATKPHSISTPNGPTPDEAAMPSGTTTPGRTTPGGAAMPGGRATAGGGAMPEGALEGWVGLVPGGLMRGPAVLGCVAGLRVLEVGGWAEPDAEVLRGTLASVGLPGRMSWHSVGGAGEVFVDSAINGAGVAAALEAARAGRGRVDRVLLCLPDHKDLAGAIRELEGLPVTFVRLPYEHLRFQTALPAEWHVIDADALTLPLLAGLGDRIVALGTVYFTGRILDLVGANTGSLFEVPE